MHKFEFYERIKVENIMLSSGRGRNRQAQRPADFPPTYEEALESPPYEEPPLVRVMDFYRFSFVLQINSKFTE